MKTHSADAYRECALEEALEKLIAASDALTSAIEGATSQFDVEKNALMDATSAAEKVLEGCQDETSITIVWTVEDVRQIRPDLTIEQAMQVLDRVERKHDAGIGINWETIEIHADYLFPQKGGEA